MEPGALVLAAPESLTKRAPKTRVLCVILSRSRRRRPWASSPVYAISPPLGAIIASKTAWWCFCGLNF